MELRYIDYAAGNFSSCRTDSTPPASAVAARVPHTPPTASNGATPANSRARTRGAVAPATSGYDLVPVSDVKIAAAAEAAPVHVRELFTSGDIPDAVLVADGAVAATLAPPQAPTPRAPTQGQPEARIEENLARLAERRAREAERHAEREAERRKQQETVAAQRLARQSAQRAHRSTARAAKEAERRRKRAAKQAARRERETDRDRKRIGAAPFAGPRPVSKFHSRAANVAATVGLIAAIGATGWYFSAEASRAAPAAGASTVMAAAMDPPRGTHAAIPAAARMPLPKVDRAALLAVARIENAVERHSFQRVVRVQRGDNFFVLLMRSGVPGAEAQQANISLAGVYDVRKMRAGQLITVEFGILGEEHNRFLSVRFDSNFDRTVSIQRQPRGDFVATEIRKELTTNIVRNNGTIDHSVFQAVLQSGLPPEPVIRMINLFAYDVDFQRDVQKGDSFETLVEQQRDARGEIVRYGDILYASLTIQGNTFKLYRWQSENGDVDYLNEKGESSRKALMRTPIDGARLSSGFGYRRHPVLGYSRLHQGLDFAAAKGTPIYAAGSGEIVRIGWAGGYGNAISIRHNKEYLTLYGHMSGFAQGMTMGKRVKQGDVIGYVGTTGMSTGPHLHYEVHYREKAIDPLTLKLPSHQKLQGAELARFLDLTKNLDARYRLLAKNGGTGNGLVMASEQEADSGCVNGARLDPTDKRVCN